MKGVRIIVFVTVCACAGACRTPHVAPPAPGLRADVARRLDSGPASRRGEGLLHEADAVALALERSPRIGRALAAAGVARAELLEALTPENPRLGLAARWPHEGGGAGIDLDVLQEVLTLVFRPARGAAARAQYDAERQTAVAEIVEEALDVSVAWYGLVTARQLHAMRLLIAEAAGASEAVAERMAEAGTLSRLGLAREAATHAQAASDALAAQAEVVEQGERLWAAIGSCGEEAGWRVPDSLPAVPASEQPLERLLQTALCARADLRAARAHRQALAIELGITQSTGPLAMLEAGGSAERESAGEWASGPALEVEIPLFHQGQARRARAVSAWREAVWAERVLASEVRRDVRTHRLRLGVLRRQVEIHAQQLIPARERVVAQSQMEYDFMLIGVDKLLEAKRDEFEAYTGYVEAIRDYWIERVHLERAVGVRLQVAASPDVALPAPGSGEGPMHERHDGMDEGGGHGEHAGHGEGGGA